MSWFVYVAKSRIGRYYVGITSNLGRRLAEHNSGWGSQLAKQQGPFELVYRSGTFATKSEARIRETQIKGWTKIKKENLIKGIWN